MNARIVAKSTHFAVALSTLLLILVCLPRTYCETFTATASLQALVRQENWILDTIDTHIRKAEQRLADMKIVVANMRNDKAFTNFDERLAQLDHPIDAVNIIKRWANLGNSQEQTGCGLKGATDDMWAQGVTLPTQDDYLGSLHSLLRLQKVYLLEASDLADGRIRNITSMRGLEASDMHELGLVARRIGEKRLARDWLQLAMDRHDSSSTVSLRELYFCMAELHREQGDVSSAVSLGIKALESGAPGDETNHTLNDALARWRLQEKEILADPQHTPFDSRTWDMDVSSHGSHTHRHYMSLCRGESYRSSRVLSQLFCHYKLGLLPYVQYKEEVFNLDPRLSLFYDVISDEESRRVMELAYPTLYRAQVGDPAVAYTTEERISKLTWLWDQTGDALIGKLSRRVQDLSGLSTEYKISLSHAEPFQVVNYGIGGQYNPHHDFYESPTMLDHLPDFIKHTGDRVATFMFYLSQVKAGGSTVFPELGVEVPATKNAAAFWYNVKPNGENDYRTLHAGCPVLLGHKWVSNKWIRDYPQMFRRPCGRTYRDLDLQKGVRYVGT